MTDSSPNMSFTSYPAGARIEGKITTQGEAGVVIEWLVPSEVEGQPPKVIGVTVMSAKLGFDLSKLLGQASAAAEIGAANYRKENARRLAHSERQAHGGLVLPPGVNHAKTDA